MEGQNEHIGKMLMNSWRVSKVLATLTWGRGERRTQTPEENRSSPSCTLGGGKRPGGTLSKGLRSQSANLGFMDTLCRYL